MYRYPPVRENCIVLRNVASNIVRSIALEPWVDRQGRLSGNLIGFGLCAKNIDA
jgi:hypothetical protein